MINCLYGFGFSRSILTELTYLVSMDVPKHFHCLGLGYDSSLFFVWSTSDDDIGF